MNAYTQQYQQNQILSASPEQILVMLYDGAIRFVRQAVAGIENNDLTAKLEGISRCMAIITEFANTLDHEIGGEIAENLDGLYSFMIRELTQANLKNDVDKLRVVEGLLLDLRETWVSAIEVARNEVAASDSAAADAAEPTPTQTKMPPNYKPLSAAG